MKTVRNLEGLLMTIKPDLKDDLKRLRESISKRRGMDYSWFKHEYIIELLSKLAYLNPDLEFKKEPIVIIYS